MNQSENTSTSKEQKYPFAAIHGILCGTVLTIGGIPLILFLAFSARSLLAPILPDSLQAAISISSERSHFPTAEFAGLLILLQLGIAYFVDAFMWVGEPMQKARLGSIVRLQFSPTPAKVRACLNDWQSSLLTGIRRNLDRDKEQMSLNTSGQDESIDDVRAGKAMRAAVAESLYRDFGFITIFTIVFGFGLWYCDTPLEMNLYLPWYVLPMITLVADVLEDICHLRYLKLHEDGKWNSPAGSCGIFTFASFLLSCIKLVTFFTMVMVVTAGVLAASALIASTPGATGWRGVLALLITVTTVLVGLAMGIGILVYQLVNRNQTSDQPDQTNMTTPEAPSGSSSVPA